MAKAAKPAGKPGKPATASPAPVDTRPAAEQLLGRTVLRWSQIEADPDNPRKHFDEEALDELGVSIATEGLLQNLLVRPPEAGATHYRLVAGERRWRAIGRAIAKDLIDDASFDVPVDVRELSDEQAAYLALLENMARKDLKPLEEARHFRLLIDRHGQTTASIAEKTGFTQRFVQQRLQLLELRENDMQALEAGRITIEDARTRVANYPKPITISAAAKVVFLEVAHRIAKAKGQFWTKVECHYQTAEPAAAMAEIADKIDTDLQYGSGGQMRAGLRYGSRQLLAQLTGQDDVVLDAIETALAAARTELNPDAPAPIAGPYLTPWLNKPFTCDPAEAERLVERKAAEAERQKDYQRQQADEKAKKDAAGEARQVALAFDKEPVSHERIGDIVARCGHPLPWRWSEGGTSGDGQLLDAAGANIELDTYYDPGAVGLLPLLMALVNAAAGHPPMVAVEALDQEDFEDIIGEAVAAAPLGDEDQVDGNEILEAWLKSAKTTFGAVGHDWNRPLAEQIAAEEIARRSAAPAEDDDIPASLKKLVDGTARPITEAVEA